MTFASPWFLKLTNELAGTPSESKQRERWIGNCLPLSLKFFNLVIARHNFTKHEVEIYLSDDIGCAACFFTSSCCCDQETSF